MEHLMTNPSRVLGGRGVIWLTSCIPSRLIKWNGCAKLSLVCSHWCQVGSWM